MLSNHLILCCPLLLLPSVFPSSGHRTGKGQFSFQSQRRAMPKNVQTTVQLPSFYMLVRLGSKSSKLGFSSTWTENFQMHKLDWEKAEEPFANMCWIIEKSKEIQKNIYFCFINYTKVFDSVDCNKLENSLRGKWNCSCKVEKAYLQPALRSHAVLVFRCNKEMISSTSG